MDGFELFDDAPAKEIISKRIDISSFDPIVKELQQCIQQLIGKHLSVLKKELQENEDLKVFSDRISTIYRLLCIQEYSTLEIESEEVSDLLWEKLLEGNSVICCKEAFLISQLTSSFSSLCIQLVNPLLVVPDQLVKRIQKVDRAHMMGAPVIITTALHQEFEKLRQKNQNRMKSVQCTGKHLQVPEKFQYNVMDSKTLKNKIPVFDNLTQPKPMSVPQFQMEIYEKKQPIIFHASNAHWKAFRKWRDLSLWCKEYGHHLVPIEIGRLDPLKSKEKTSWKESVFTFQDYIHQFIQPNVELCQGNELPGPLDHDKIGYLAQHHLFDQFPSLKEDFDIPPYCKVSQEGQDMDHVKMNAWFGTQDTVTSLHFDSYDNFLTQIFGYKYVRLYPPTESENLYPIQGETSNQSITKQNNISPVDVENPDYTKYPKSKDAEYVECILGPHDMLYIPHQWWHYVRSLTPSFSVNFWF